MREGTIVLSDTKEHLEVVRQKRTGLFMVRIDHLDRRSYGEAISDHDRADKLILPNDVQEELYGVQQAKLQPKAADHESFPAPGTSPASDEDWIYSGVDDTTWPKGE